MEVCLLCYRSIFFPFSTSQCYVLKCSVTLLGAHTVGHVHIANSGYGRVDSTADPLLLNAWDDTPNVFDNRYYIFLAFQVIVIAKKLVLNLICISACSFTTIFIGGGRIYFRRGIKYSAPWIQTRTAGVTVPTLPTC